MLEGINWSAVFLGYIGTGVTIVGGLVWSTHKKVNEMNGDFKGLKEWKLAHEKQDDTFHGEMKKETEHIWIEVNKLREK